MQEVAAASNNLVLYNAKQLSLAAQDLRKRLEASKQAALPKKKFAFSKKGPQLKPAATEKMQLARLAPADDAAHRSMDNDAVESKAKANSQIVPER